MPVIYIDVLFAANFTVDFLLLWCTGKMAGMKIRWWRILAGAVLGGLYSVFIFFPQLSPLYLVFSKIAASAALLAVSFRITAIKEFLRLILTFYISNFILGGSIMGLMYFTSAGGNIDSMLSNGSVYFNLPFGVLFFVALGVTLLVQATAKYLRSTLMKQGVLCRVTLVLNKKIVKLHGLLDTGNSLTDPITRLPVLVAELSGVEKLFPPDVAACMQNSDINFIYEAADLVLACKLRLIPYSAVGTENGMLIAFRPDMAVIEKEDAAPLCCDCVVAVSPHKINAAKGYKIIVNPDILI